MRLKILTPEKIVLDQEVTSVTLPGSEGEMTVLPTHAALIATLKPGKLLHFFIDEGFVEVLKDQVLVMTKSLRTPKSDPNVASGPK